MCYLDGTVTSGSYFEYEGVKYGKDTKITLTREAYNRYGLHYTTFNPRLFVFHSIEEDEYGEEVWKLCTPNFAPFYPHDFYGIVPERDIEQIAVPVYYMTPRELVKSRFRDGTWFSYIWQQTLVYVLCLIISPIFQEWYLIWTTGLYLYLRLCYIELSRGGLNSGW